MPAQMGQAFFIGSSMTWTERNVGLDNKSVNYITQHPSTRHLLDSSFHELWAATDGGIFHTLNGGRQWAQVVLPLPDNSQFQRNPPTRADQLLYVWIDYDPTNSDILYVYAWFSETTNRTWIYKTTDSGLTWISKGVTWL